MLQVMVNALVDSMSVEDLDVVGGTALQVSAPFIKGAFQIFDVSTRSSRLGSRGQLDGLAAAVLPLRMPRLLRAKGGQPAHLELLVLCWRRMCADAQTSGS